MIKLILHGLGRLGRSINDLAVSSDGFSVVAWVKNTNMEEDVVPVYTDITECNQNADVIIDASVASAVPPLVAYALSKKIPLVICTTALDDDTLKQIHNAAAEIPVFLSANMSAGVNLVAKLAGVMAKMFADFDIEIVERHHSGKLDAPSGTAKFLAESIISAAGEKDMVCGRHGFAKRRPNEIGIHAIRGGNVVGEHTVIFAGNNETIEIKHSVLSKDVFAFGVLQATKFIVLQKPGLYTMEHLIKI